MWKLSLLHDYKKEKSSNAEYGVGNDEIKTWCIWKLKYSSSSLDPLPDQEWFSQPQGSLEGLVYPGIKSSKAGSLL